MVSGISNEDDLEILKLLIGNGADVNAKGHEDGKTHHCRTHAVETT